MKNLNDKKIVFGIGIVFLFLATIGFSYAYFAATLVNKDVKDQVVQTGTLSLTYTDGTAINGVNIRPGWKATKTITIENTGTLDAFYTIFWKDLVNEITNDELVMSLECESSTDTCATINFQNKTVPSSKNAISENIIIYPGEVQTITLNFEFKELNKAQDYNQGKKFNGVINIEDSTKLAFQTEYTMYTRVVDQNDNPLANMTVELHSDVKSGITDENGYVRISGIVSGKHELYVKDSNGNTLDTKNIEITQKKESNITNDSIIYIDSSLTEFTNTIKLTEDNKLDSIENLIVPPDECFGVSGSAIIEYYSNTNDKCPKELIIPSKVNGVKITSLEKKHYACSYYSNVFAGRGLKKVIIPDTIENISYDAFRDNNLTNIDIPKSVKNIGNGAFNNNQLEDSQAIIYKRNDDGSEDKTTIVSYGGKNKNVIIPNGVTSIGNYAFANNNLTSVTIPNSVTSIGNYTFQNNNLTSLIIPNSIKTIGDWAFEHNNLTSLTLSDGVTSIGSWAFQNNNLTSLIIPNSVTSIGGSAFEHNNLTSLTLPDGVTSIGSWAFAYNSLMNLTIPNSVTSIGSYAFLNNNLTSLTLSDGVTSIGSSAFRHNNLTSLTIPNSVTNIDEDAFQNNLIENLVLPISITSIGYGAFNDNKLPDSQAFIYKRNTDGSEDKTTIISYGGKNKNITIPSNIATIERSAFAYNDLTSVIIPNSVITIESIAFMYNDLKDIKIPNSVKTIGGSAFGHNNLTSITIPSSTTVIAYGAFSDNNLKQVTIQGKSSSSEFITYSPKWGWASDVTCVKNNTSNVTNGCITWGAK
ncbi:leucine-rich repeat protein [Holdemanella sp. SCCA2]|nr:leucine-rich repeat protein [Holdemanella sp. SCCA2]